MSKKDKQKTLQEIIWINLIIGIYNLFIFTSMSSYFHLILGSINIGVWVFNRDKLNLYKINWTINKKVGHKNKH